MPNAVQQHTEQETIWQSIKQRQSGSAHYVMWPTIGGTPINKSRVLQHGLSHIRDAGQQCNQVTIGNYFKHMLPYKDGRFAKHPRFRFFALNTEIRWRALQAGTSANIQISHDMMHWRTSAQYLLPAHGSQCQFKQLSFLVH